jgi:hypothetical protein
MLAGDWNRDQYPDIALPMDIKAGKGMPPSNQ